MDAKTSQSQSGAPADSDALLPAAQLRAIETSYARLKAAGLREVTDRFYAALFYQRPDLQPLFANVDQQSSKLAGVLATTTMNLRNERSMQALVDRLAVSHARLHLSRHDYTQFGVVLAGVIADLTADTPEEWDAVHRAWAAAIRLVSNALLVTNSRGR